MASSSQLCSIIKQKHDSYNLRAKDPKFAKRVSTLKKKAMELSVLCDVPVCVICYGPDGDLHCWPENPLDVRGLVAKYRGLSDEDRMKHSVDLRGFLATETKKNAKKPILESSAEMDPNWDERIDGFSDEELRDLMSRLDSKLVQLTAKLNGMMNSEEADQLVRTNVHLPGVIDYDSHMQEPRVHHIELAHEKNSNLVANDFFRELKSAINYELPHSGSDADSIFLGFDTTTTTNDVIDCGFDLFNNYELRVSGSQADRGFLGFEATTNDVTNYGFDFSRENLWSSYGDVYSYGFMELGDNIDAEIQQIHEEPPLLQYASLLMN